MHIDDVGAIDIESLENGGGTGIGQGGFNGQTLTANANGTMTELIGQEQAAFYLWILADQLWLNGDVAFTTDSHAVQSQFDAMLSATKETGISESVVQGDVESGVQDDRALVSDRSVGISNVDVSSNSSAPSSQGSLANQFVDSLNEVTLSPLESLAKIFDVTDFPGVQTSIELGIAPGLGQNQGQQNQDALQHNLSFGSQTVSTDRNLVNNSEAISQQLSALSLDQLALLNKATITIADLADGYLALTSGTTITLDTDAAGYGWFVDPTPLLSEEFIPTLSLITGHASPWQLTAAPGSAAAGHIDLMTVLMHELGHVMGLEHVSSAVDATRLMAASIDPGIRRLPSALDLGVPSAQPSALSTQPPDQSVVWAPYLTHYTVTASGEQAPAPVINPARLVEAAQIPSHQGIFNSGFGISDPANTQFGWDSSGAITIANGQAVLSEDSNVISTLSQLFTLPAGSTHLRFTLLDVNLQSNGTNRPPDAFEVALLEASTMTPLAGVVSGLDRTDSLLNLQADGTMFLAPGVTVTPLASSLSPRAWLVDIDLTGIAAGAGARLSFDLLGFGDRTSTVVLDNVLLTNGQPTAAPVAVNDAYTVAEGGTLLRTQTSGLLSNDTDTDTPQGDLSSALVNGPLHGTLTLNADGSFTYMHNGSETLSDAFTYRVSDGINLSNLATVSFTITPTNDAPVISPIAPQMVEQGRTLTVTVLATDPNDSNSAPESNVLTYGLAPGAPSGASIDPSTGVLTWAVPHTQTVGLYTMAGTVTDAGTPALSATRSVTVEMLALSNTAPTLDAIGPKSVNEESEIRLTIAA